MKTLAIKTMMSYDVIEVIKIKKIAVNSSVPLYIQVYNAIFSEIKLGNYVNGDKIPSENDLCEIYGVSRITVRKAIEELEERGVVEKKHGKGTFVSYPIVVEEVSAGGSFTRSSQLVNTKPTTKVISCTQIMLKDLRSKVITNLFQNHNSVIRVERIRYADSNAMIFETDYFFSHHEFIYQSDLENIPLLDTISSKTGLQAAIFEDKFDVILSNEEIASHLNCEESTPLLKVEQKVLTENDELIYFNEQIIRQDLYKYVVRSEKI